MRCCQTSCGLAHRDPDVGVEEVGALDTLVDVFGERDAGAGLRRALPVLLDELVGRPELLRRDDAHVHTKHGARFEQRTTHVVAGIAQEGVGDLLERFVRVFSHGQDIGQHLGRMELVGQTVVDRHAGISAPGSRPAPARSRGTRSRRTCARARGRCPSSIPCGRSAILPGRDRSRARPDRRPPPRTRSACGSRSFRRSGRSLFV